jgi:hypothetical protein
MNRNNSFASIHAACALFVASHGTMGIRLVPSWLFAASDRANNDAMKELFQHAATTDGVTVRVAVNFLPEQSRIEAGKWFWVYHIRIENDSEHTLQLLTRHWRITDGRGSVSFVDGEGVVGETPCCRRGRAMITSRAARWPHRTVAWRVTTPSAISMMRKKCAWRSRISRSRRLLLRGKATVA